MILLTANEEIVPRMQVKSGRPHPLLSMLGVSVPRTPAEQSMSAADAGDNLSEKSITYFAFVQRQQQPTADDVGSNGISCVLRQRHIDDNTNGLNLNFQFVFKSKTVKTEDTVC